MRKERFLPVDQKRDRIKKVDATTNPFYGKKPSERSIEELLQNGVINLDKPSGPTSHQVDVWVKEVLEVEKTGHAGTLDPKVTGVLPIGVGQATKALPVLLKAGKEYIAVMTLHGDVSENKIYETCRSFIGNIIQLPPVRSAVRRVKRRRRIYYLDILEIDGRNVLFRVGCQAGTYIRTLCVDIGRKLGCGAHLRELRRTRSGHLREEDSVILQDVKDAYVFWKEDGDEEELRKILFPMEYILDALPKIIIRDSAVDAICHGADLAIPGVVELDSGIKKGDIIAIMTLKGEGVALAKSLLSTEEILQKDTGLCARLQRVFMKKGTYPDIWRKH